MVSALGAGGPGLDRPRGRRLRAPGRLGPRSRRTAVIRASGQTSRTRYNAAGQVIEQLAPGQSEGQGLRIEYDSAGRPVKTTSASGLVTTTAYDEIGRPAQTRDPAGNAIAYEYAQPAANWPACSKPFATPPTGKAINTTSEAGKPPSRNTLETAKPKPNTRPGTRQATASAQQTPKAEPPCTNTTPWRAS